MKRISNMVLFWGMRDVCSNWHPATFVVDDVTYNCSEQYMMHRKALRFGDTEVAAKVMAEPDPRQQKALGRQVRGYVDEVWLTECEDIMLPGLVAKFTQNPSMGAVLLGTDDDEIVEASPSDPLWGVGLGQDDPRILNKATWRGLNLLGNVLMRARAALRAAAPVTSTQPLLI